MNMLDDSLAQRLRTVGGKRLEQVVIYILNAVLNSYDIFIVPGTAKGLKQLISDKTIVKQIIDYNKLPVKRPCDQKQLEDYPDSDLFVIVKSNLQWRVLGIINCKLSFHSRHTMVTFWGLAIRLGANIKYVCVTEDKDQYRKINPRSEFGKSCVKSTATRRLLESFVDRSYIINPYKPDDPKLFEDIKKFDPSTIGSIVFDNPNHKYHTEYCASVRPFDDLINDLLRWKEDRESKLVK